jgi:hypothetical protein
VKTKIAIPTNDQRVRPAMLSAICLAAMLAAGLPAAPVLAQEMMELTVPAFEYSLGRFKYKAPSADGWRQMANIQNSLSLVYAEQKGPESIETVFGAVLESHDIPPENKVESAAALAELSRTQMAENRKAELVGISPIEAVPSIDNLYTYRLLVHSPLEGQPDVYEVYYVGMAPDGTQYVVIQCITKTDDYGNQLYFQQFYGSLASLKYTGADASPAKPAETSPAKPAEAAPAKPAESSKPAAP